MPNPSSTSLDHLLGQLPHYQSFPAMMPFVGQNYDSPNHSKLLILGESFFLPKESTIHKNASAWYVTKQAALTRTEIEWINCRELLECDWKAGAHKIYRELNSCLCEVGMQSTERAVSHISYTNTFMRPAVGEGQSIKDCQTRQDFDVSRDTLQGVITALAPDMVIFASKYAWDTVGCTIGRHFSGMEFYFVSHPAGHFYWRRKKYPHGRQKLMSLLKTWAQTAAKRR